MEANIIISQQTNFRTMSNSSPDNSILLPNKSILSNSLDSSNCDSKEGKFVNEKQNQKKKNCQQELVSKPLLQLLTSESEQSAKETHFNEDVCFKCKKAGQIFCCQNCFRSVHWKCIGSKKINELNKMTYLTNFICQACDTQNNCTKCNSHYPEDNPKLIDYSDHGSILGFYRCTHCYSKIHKKCLDYPLEIIQKPHPDMSDQEIFPHYVCVKCLENVGITEVIKSQRVVHSFLGVERLYFNVLLNTNSPIHKGWFQQFVLKEHMKKFADNQTFINDFLRDKSLFERPQIEKIIEIRFPIKYKNIPISQVWKIIESKMAISIQQSYGNHDNFKFLVKWKHRDYNSLTWEDQTIALKNIIELKRFLSNKQKLACISDYIQSYKVQKKNGNQRQQINYKVVEYFLTDNQNIRQKYLQINKEIDPYNKIQYKSFQQRMLILDSQNAKQPFIQFVQVQFQNLNQKFTYDYMEKFFLYFKLCHKTEIIIRPILIISDRVNEWEKTLKNQNLSKNFPLRYIKFFGGKNNTNAIKRWDFLATENSVLFKFDLLLMDYNYFLYEKGFIFQNIPSLFLTLFDKSQKYSSQTQKFEFIKKNYMPFKTKVQKEIYLFQHSSYNQPIEQFANQFLSSSEITTHPVKNAVYHTLEFSRCLRFNSSEPKLKLIIDKKYKESTKIFESPSKETLNQGQRLSFLKFIMAYGLNVKKVQDVCAKLKEMNPSIWLCESRDMNKSKQLVKNYISLFVSLVIKNTKELQPKINEMIPNHFLFSYQTETVFKRIIQLKKLKTCIESCSDDYSKFPITKTFKFFSSGQCKNFPLWNIYEDYTLAALILDEGYQRWNQIINSKKWVLYHSELMTRRMLKFDQKSSSFTIQEEVVPIKKKNRNQNGNGDFGQSNINEIQFDGKEGECQNKSEEQKRNEELPTTYGEYLINKIRNFKDFNETQYEKLLDLKVLEGHIAQRATDILNSMN